MDPTPSSRDERRDSPAPGLRLRHFTKWALAMFGVFALYLVLQVAVTVIGGVIVGVAAVVGGAGSVDGVLTDNGVQVVVVVAQLIAVAVFLPWWRRIRPGSFAERREKTAAQGASIAKTVAALLLIGFAAQFFVSCILGMVELFFPEAMAEYAEFMEEAVTGVFVVVEMVSVAILAPLNEEIVCRGIMFEYALRAVSPRWDARDRARRIPVSVRAFWLANMMQALAFGVLHMNIIQGGYAFALGAAQGWVYWRTGKLRYAILLHFALNASSYLVAPLAPAINMLPALVVFALFGAALAAGIVGFARTWPGADALSELPDPAGVSDPADASDRGGTSGPSDPFASGVEALRPL